MNVFDYVEDAALLLGRNLGIGSAEALVIVCDNETEPFGRLLERAASTLGVASRLVIFPPTGRHKAEPPSYVSEAMEQASAVVAVTRWSLVHTEARRAANRAGARVLCVSDMQVDLLERGVLTVDVDAIYPVLADLSGRLSAASKAELITGGGAAKLEFALSERTAIDQAGICKEPGTWTALPCIETAICPIEHSTAGTIVVDGAVVPGGPLREPLEIKIEDGRIVEIRGDERAAQLNALMRAEGGYGVVELGIGLNPRAELGKHFAEDEAVWGTVHVGVGDGESFGSTFRASQHLDLVTMCPTLLLDGQPVITDGILEGAGDS